MNRNFLIKSFLFMLLFIFLSGCSAERADKFPLFEAQRLYSEDALESYRKNSSKAYDSSKAEDSPKIEDWSKFDSEAYSSKIDNFFILFDASSSMSEFFMSRSFEFRRKFDVAKEVLKKMNDMIPEKGQMANLISFGHDSDVSTEDTEFLYRMERYSTEALSENFRKIDRPGGFSPLYMALDSEIFSKVSSGSRNAIIIITDGLIKRDHVLYSVRDLSSRYGFSACFFPVLVGGSKKGESFLNEILDISACGFYSRAGDLLSTSGMAGFVAQVFLERNESYISEEEVAEYISEEEVAEYISEEEVAEYISEEEVAEYIPEEEVIEEEGIHQEDIRDEIYVSEDSYEGADNDGDGIFDNDDRCLNTPIGARVNFRGCWMLSHILFDFNRYELRPEVYPLLDNIAEILEKNGSLQIMIQGHADNIGSDYYNMRLSLKRAKTVKGYLVAKGISESRMIEEGLGDKEPVSLYDTPVGHSLNRRVEFKPFY